MKIDVVASVPVPVGHRITVRWYRLKSRGLFGGESEESRPAQPEVEDLDTGIVYTSDWVLETSGVKGHREPLRVSEGLKPGIEEERSVTGRVTACRIVTVLWSDYHVQTELTIEPE